MLYSVVIDNMNMLSLCFSLINPQEVLFINSEVGLQLSVFPSLTNFSLSYPTKRKKGFKKQSCQEPWVHSTGKTRSKNPGSRGGNDEDNEGAGRKLT